LRGAY